MKLQEPEKKFLKKSWFKQNWKVFAFLVFLVLAVYTNSLNNDFVSDDINAIYENENVGNFSYNAQRYPLNFLRHFFYSIVYQVVGLQPAGFRFLGIFFHVGLVLVIYCLFIYLLYSPFLALTAASLFAVHPILSESVVWISGGTHAQYSFFVLLSFLFYIIAKSHNWSKKYYFISIISFVCALLTTEKSVILPLIILSFEFSNDQLSKIWKKILPFFLISGILVLFVFFGSSFNQRITALQSQYYQEKGLYNPLIQIPTAISSYLRLIFWPDKLTLYHSETVFAQNQYLIMSLITLCFLSIVFYTFINKKHKQSFFWLSFFIISLLPMLTPFKVAWVVAERYVYLGSLGIFFIIALIIQKVGLLFKNKQLSYALLIIIILMLGIRTINRNSDWKNQDTLWLSAEKTSVSSPQNHNNLGDYYGRQGDLEKAVSEFKKAIELKPGYADAYHNLANTYQQISKTELAIENYKKAVEFNPLLWQSFQNLAGIYFEQEKFELAQENMQKAIKASPENANLYLNSGIIYLKLDNQEQAQKQFEKAIQLDPGVWDSN